MAKGRWCRRLVRGAIVGLALAVAASVAQAAVTYFGLTFPDRVADAQLGTTHDFETTDPGLGYSVRYQKPGWAVDIYIYDLRRTSIPDDLGSDVVKAQLEQAYGDILELERRGSYKQLKQTGSHVIKDSRARARFVCEDFNYIRDNVGNVDSFLCLTVRSNKFVKFRLTTMHGPGSAAAAQRFMEAWFNVLWP